MLMLHTETSKCFHRKKNDFSQKYLFQQIPWAFFAPFSCHGNKFKKKNGQKITRFMAALKILQYILTFKLTLNLIFNYFKLFMQSG